MTEMSCTSFLHAGQDLEEVDKWAKANGCTVTFASWHPSPELRIFKTGSLLSRNDEYPSGVVIVTRKGIPNPWRI